MKVTHAQLRRLIREVLIQEGPGSIMSRGDEPHGSRRGYPCEPGPGCPGGWSPFPRPHQGPDWDVPPQITMAIQLLDPTSITSWPDLSSAMVSYDTDPGIRNSLLLGLAIVGVVPLIGKGTKAIKAYNLASDMATTGTTVRSLQRLISNFLESSPSVLKGARNLIARSSFSNKEVEALIKSARWMDDKQILQGLHKVSFILGNVKQKILSSMLTA